MADTLILNFYPPELLDNKFLLFKATQFVVICYSNPWKLIQMTNTEELTYKWDKKCTTNRQNFDFPEFKKFLQLQIEWDP